MDGAAAEIERLQAELDIHIARRAKSDAAWAISDKRTGRT
jgi:hypothetical protein